MAPGFQAAALANALGLYEIHETPGHALRGPGYAISVQPPSHLFLPAPLPLLAIICFFQFDS